MHTVTPTIISNEHTLYLYCYNNSLLANNLYNAALFRIRQIFTGWNKKTRTVNEQEVFDEVALLESTYPSIKVKHNISYSHLEKLLRVTNNPDFFGGLPMQTAQAIVKQARTDFDNWFKALEAYKQHPESFLGKPHMPGYKTPGGSCSFTTTNQDAVIYDYKLKLPLTKDRLQLGNIPETGRLMEVKVKPFYGRFIISLTFEIDDVPVNEARPNLAAIDFGTDNFAAIVCTDGSSRLYKGGAILSENQFFAKRRASAVSMITKGHQTTHCANSRYLNNLSYHHANFNKDQCHKVSRSIIEWCIKHDVGVLVLGVNKLWKQRSNIGKANNQNFVNMPILMLRSMLTYKAQVSGIAVIEQEESYTSAADCRAGDFIPVYGINDSEASFSGKRIHRGLYRCYDGMLVNADLNGAANILRKAVPTVWNEIDLSFLSVPEVLGFHELNPQSIPVKRIAAA